MNDPENVLDGTDKDMRHIQFKNGAYLNKITVVALLKQAAEPIQSTISDIYTYA